MLRLKNLSKINYLLKFRKPLDELIDLYIFQRHIAETFSFSLVKMKITCCAAAVCCCNSANSLKSSFKLIEDDELVLTDSVDENLIIGLNPGEYGDEGA